MSVLTTTFLHRSRIKLLSLVTNLPDYKILTEPENKLTLLVLRKLTKTFLARYLNKAPSLHLLEENTATLHFSLMFYRTSPLKFIFLKTIDQLIDNGVVQKIVETSSLADRKVNQDDEPSPQQLTIDHLGICFVVIVICLGISCTVFILEFFAGYWSKRRV
jgi:hypothetical protein